MVNPQPPLQAVVADSSGAFTLPWIAFFTALRTYLTGLPPNGSALPDYLNDAAAAAGGVALYGYYRNGSVVMQRVV